MPSFYLLHALIYLRLLGATRLDQPQLLESASKAANVTNSLPKLSLQLHNNTAYQPPNKVPDPYSRQDPLFEYLFKDFRPPYIYVKQAISDLREYQHWVSATVKYNLAALPPPSLSSSHYTRSYLTPVPPIPHLPAHHAPS